MQTIAAALVLAAGSAAPIATAVAAHTGPMGNVAPDPPASIAITPGALAGLPVENVALDDHGTMRRCEGPSLASLLAAHGYPQGSALRGPALVQGVHIVARDGYRVLLSLGEIDPLLGKAQAILATRCDGAALDEQSGPVRLIVGGDDRPARAVRQVERVDLVIPAAN